MPPLSFSGDPRFAGGLTWRIRKESVRYAARVSGKTTPKTAKSVEAEVLDPESEDEELDASEVDEHLDEGEVEDVDIIDVDVHDDASEVDTAAADADGDGTAVPEVLVTPPPASAKPAKKSASTALEPASALSAYMAQLANHAPISREEEHELAVRWVEEGDVDAARQMVLSNLRLVVKIAMEYRRAWTNTLDLIQEGNVGLMEAVQRYDPYQGVKLSSYAVYWIRAYILKYILDNLRSVRLGTTRAGRKLFFRLNKERRALELEGFEVTPKLLAERLDVGEDDVVAMQAQLSRPDLSLDAPRFDDDGRETYGDSLSGGIGDAEDTVGRSEMSEVFRQAISVFSQDLGERDLQILNERILADEPRTLAEMGEEFGVSRERVRQLEARIIKKLREYMKEELVDFDLYAEEPDA